MCQVTYRQRFDFGQINIVDVSVDLWKDVFNVNGDESSCGLKSSNFVLSLQPRIKHLGELVACIAYIAGGAPYTKRMRIPSTLCGCGYFE